MSNNKINDIEMKKILLDILLYIDCFCKKNNIRYYLAGGTLLGAIRHKGFIPWDDDIDIAMPREDYNRFYKLMQNEIGNKYKCYTYNNKGYMFSFMKVVDSTTVISEKKNKEFEFLGAGIFVDIFPIDGLGNTKEMAIITLKIYRFLSMLVFSRVIKKSKNVVTLKEIVVEFFGKILGIRRILMLIDKYSKIKQFDHSRYIGSAIAGQAGIKEIIEYKYFAETCEVEFEGNIFPAPVGWEIYLTNLYGDYMQLPPVEKRHTNHSFDAYWK